MGDGYWVKVRPRAQIKEASKWAFQILKKIKYPFILLQKKKQPFIIFYGTD